MGWAAGNAAPGLDDQKIEGEKLDADHVRRQTQAASVAKYDDQLQNEEHDAAAGHGPGPLERFKRWFSARF